MKILKPHLRIDEHFELISRKNLDESLETLRKCQRIKKKKKSVQIRRRPVINLQKFRLLWICWFKLNYVFTQLLTVDVLPVFFLTCLLCSCSVAERLAGVEAFDPLTFWTLVDLPWAVAKPSVKQSRDLMLGPHILSLQGESNTLCQYELDVKESRYDWLG